MAISLRGLHPVVRQMAENALAYADHYGLNVTVTSTYRDWAKQAQLREKYEQCVREGRYPSPPDCKYPANRPGDSAHNYGLAFDSVMQTPRGWSDQYTQQVWNYFRQYAGFAIPSPESDPIHAEYPNWRSYV